MRMNGLNLLFYIKKGRNYTGGEAPVYMRITIAGQSKDIHIKQTCDPDQWDTTRKRATGRKAAIRELNAVLDRLEAMATDASNWLTATSEPVTAESVMNVIRQRAFPGTKRYMLMEIFTHHNQQAAELVGREYVPETLVRFKTTWKHTRDYLLWKYKVPDIDIQKLNYEFVSDFEFWFKSVKNCDHNTSIKYIACCRKIVLRCIRNGWLRRDPFAGFNMALREVHREALTEDELRVITSKRLSTGRLRHIRNVFLFSCFTGLAYADLKKLTCAEIGIGMDGEKWIFTKRQKTDTPTRVPLLPAALEILEKYKDHPVRQLTGLAMPMPSNQKTNAYLKEIGTLCGIHKRLTFHLARHTFATTVTLSNGVPIETVSRMLGHKDLKTTQQYAKILDLKISRDMRALKEKLAGGDPLKDRLSRTDQRIEPSGIPLKEMND